jgi:hypothetical protein
MTDTWAFFPAGYCSSCERGFVGSHVCPIVPRDRLRPYEKRPPCSTCGALARYHRRGWSRKPDVKSCSGCGAYITRWGTSKRWAGEQRDREMFERAGLPP